MDELDTIRANETGNETPANPSGTLSRPLDIEEALYEDIRTHGVIVPIVVDKHMNIIDGHVRKRLADALGLDCPYTVIDGDITEEDREYLRAVLNGLRRPATPEEQRALLRSIGVDGKWRPHQYRRGQEAYELAAQVVTMLEQGKSFRQIASELNISVGSAHRYSRIGMALATGKKQALAVAQALNTTSIEPGAHTAASVLAQAERTPIHDASVTARYQVVHNGIDYLRNLQRQVDVVLCTEPLPPDVLPHALALAQSVLATDGWALLAVDTPRGLPKTAWRTQWVVDLSYSSETDPRTGVRYAFRLFLLVLAPQFNPDTDWLSAPPAFARNIVREYLRLGTRPETTVVDLAYGGTNYMWEDVPATQTVCLGGVFGYLCKIQT